jgi:DNA-binding IclR family transcriptional regulator
MKQQASTSRSPARADDEAADDRSSSATHRSLTRGLAVLETIAGAGQPLALSDVAARLGLARSTTHHLLKALVESGYVRKDASGREYQLADKLHRLLGRRWRPEQLGDMAQPWLEELSHQTRLGSSVAAWWDGAVRIVAKRDNEGPVRVVQDVGATRPIHCTAVGKAIAAWLPPEELEAALDRATFERHTPKTITSRRGLVVELGRVRASGQAFDDEEMHQGIRCLAMPVFDFDRRPVASMCVLGPGHLVTLEQLPFLRASLARVAHQFSEQLGYDGPDDARSRFVRRS